MIRNRSLSALDTFDRYVQRMVAAAISTHSIQAYSGVFHFLPLGLRIQEKLEKLIDKHMRLIGMSILLRNE